MLHFGYQVHLNATEKDVQMILLLGLAHILL